ncbi:hypothetical protein [Defluviimonas sp. WL0075]|uniref:Uncharacterized protein n=1 Tax=Albidovulum sediminicola TaxID=2984331 RepID=A0ABT2YWV9_9RHOB|nr:hypothetical protein [Defluviimonas sp. WL0075]MCV2863305.1 hypothetical protein [Defluviimonas sp. WL0075]
MTVKGDQNRQQADQGQGHDGPKNHKKNVERTLQSVSVKPGLRRNVNQARWRNLMRHGLGKIVHLQRHTAHIRWQLPDPLGGSCPLLVTPKNSRSRPDSTLTIDGVGNKSPIARTANFVKKKAAMRPV